MSSMYLGNLKISIFGQSHGKGIGVVIDGLPAGERIDMDALRAFMQRRSPGNSDVATARKEEDLPEILSGLVNGVTCGAPLCAVIENKNAHPSDYDALKHVPRPGHADYTAHIKYGGFQDAAGGGHFSGRLTAPLIFAGGICKQILERRGVVIGAPLWSVGQVRDERFDPVHVTGEQLLLPGRKAFPTLSDEAGEKMRESILSAKAMGDSLGGVIECACTGVPAGLGDPMFDGMENRLSRILFAIPAVKGVEFGAGFGVADLFGSENNDDFIYQADGTVETKTNNHGGSLGGISSGMPLVFRAAFKPTPSISREQDTISISKRENDKLAVVGRHDPCIVPRAVPCVEAAAAVAVLDLLCRM